MPYDVTVRVKAPEGVSSSQVLQYVRDAVKRYAGCLRPTDPCYPLGRRCAVLGIRGSPGLPRGMKHHTTSRGDTFAVRKERHEL